MILLCAERFLVQGVKINTPHYLAKLPKLSKGSSTYTVVVSQLDSLSAIYYTLKVRVLMFKSMVMIKNFLSGIFNLSI